MSEACNNFSQHAWKHELCSNCMKPRDKHTIPVPAKRPVKAPKPPKPLPNDSPSKDGGAVDQGNGLHKQRPEARVKPTIAAKPNGSDAETKGLGRAKPAVNIVKPNVAPPADAQTYKGKNDGAQGVPVSADGAYDDVPKPKPVPPGKLKQDPFYDEYDVSFKGLSGKPVPIGQGGQARNRSLDRLKNDVEIVMPYNVVDVSTDPPVKDPDSPGHVSSPLASGKLAGGSPLNRRRGGSPQFQRNIRILEGGSKSPGAQRKALAAGADNGYYEDVEDPEIPDQGQPFVRNSPGRLSNQKSAVFEAKLSTIAQNLDLINKKGTSKTPESDGSKPIPPPPLSGECSPTLSKKDKKKNKEDLKHEKQRKGSTGKSFFKKLFGRGGTDSEDNDPGADSACDSDGGGGKTDDEGSNKGSAPPSVESSPMLSHTRRVVDPEKPDVMKKVGRGDSLKKEQPNMFNAELRQALAKTSKIGEKDITASVAKIRETKKTEAKASDIVFSELKGSPLFDRRTQQSEPNAAKRVIQEREKSPQKLAREPPTNVSNSSPGNTRKSLVVEGPIVHGAAAPVRCSDEEKKPMESTGESTPSQKTAPAMKQEPPETKPKPDVKAKPEKTENKPKLDGTIKRRPAPAAPPPPIPISDKTNRNSSCTSPVSPRPGAPPPSPKPPPEAPPLEEAPRLPEKTNSKKRNSLKADEMMGLPDKISGKKIEISAPLPPPPPSPKQAAHEPPPPAPPPPPLLPTPDAPAPKLPEKCNKKRNSLKSDDMAAQEVYSRRPEISAPRLQRTSAVLDGVVDAGLGASLCGDNSLGSPVAAKMVSPSVSPSSTLTHEKKQRPRSEISEGKMGSLRRKPESAPPPPPAPPDRRLSANDISPTDDLIKRLSRASSEDASRKTHTFPREGTREKEPLMGGTLGRQTQRARARTDRAQTLSEGIGCELEAFTSVLKHETISDLANELKELSGKFVQRKLPSPPKEVYYGPENYYETVYSDEEDNCKVGKKTRIKGDAITQMRERERRERSLTPYEDVDGECYDDRDLSRRKKEMSPGMVWEGSEKAAEMVNQCMKQQAVAIPPTHNPVMTSSAEYLQPVAHDHSPQDECLSHGPVIGAHPIPLVMNLSGSSKPESAPLMTSSSLVHAGDRGNDWRPKPIPRKPQSSPSSSATSSSYVFLYTEEITELGPRPFGPVEGWQRLGEKHVAILEQIRSSLDSLFIGAPVSPSNLRWDDFALESFVPVFSNIGISFYRATTHRLCLKECLLMLSLCPLPTEVPPQTHLGILHPSALYQDHVSALLFPDNTADPRVYGQCGKVPTTVWVLPYASVCSFEEYCIGLRGLYATKLPIFHRHLCSAFQQALSAILYLLNKDCNLQCFKGDEILGVTPLGSHETFVIALPHHCHLGTNPGSNGQLALQLHQLLLRLLDDQYLASACGVSLNHSRYFRGLIQVAKVLNRNTAQNLFKAQLMCEFLLWGPGEQELQAILSSHNPQAALSVWLELERTSVIGKYAIEDFSATKEDAHRIHFLVLLSDQTLWDTVQLLLQD